MYQSKTALLAFFMALAFFSNAQTKNRMVKEKFSLEQQQVLDAIFKMTSSFHKGDIKGVMASYEPEATVVFEPGKPVSDRTAIAENFQGFFTVKPKFEYGGHEVFINGNIAIHFAPWSMTGKAPDGTEIKQSGLSVAVLRKQEDGKWLMVIDDPYGQHLLDLQ